MKSLNTTNDGKNFTIHLETDDPIMAEHVVQFIHGPHTGCTADDLRKEMDLILADRNLLKQTVDALNAKLNEANACLDKTRADRDILAQDLADVKGQLEAAKELLSRETRKNGSVAVESFNIAMSILRAEGYNVRSLMDKTAAVYVLKHRK